MILGYFIGEIIFGKLREKSGVKIITF